MRNEPAVDAEEEWQDKSAIESAMSAIITIRCIHILKAVKILEAGNDGAATFEDEASRLSAKIFQQSR